MKRLVIIGCLVLAACGGSAQAEKPVTITHVATVEDCNLYKVSNSGELLVICKTSNPALVRN